MRAGVMLFFVLALLMVLVAPCCFAETVPAIVSDSEAQSQAVQSDATGTAQQSVSSTQSSSSSGTLSGIAADLTSADDTAGIRPVSPEEFAGKVNSMVNGMYGAASPVADTLAKLMLAAAGIVALFVLFSGMKLFQKVLGAALCVGFGLLLFYGAPYIVALVKGLVQYAAR